MGMANKICLNYREWALQHDIQLWDFLTSQEEDNVIFYTVPQQHLHLFNGLRHCPNGRPVSMGEHAVPPWLWLLRVSVSLISALLLHFSEGISTMHHSEQTSQDAPLPVALCNNFGHTITAGKNRIIFQIKPCSYYMFEFSILLKTFDWYCCDFTGTFEVYVH